MKKTVAIVVSASLLAASAFAGDVLLAPLSPRSPTVMAQGGSFTAVASGWDSLFTNPAGFASPKGSLTLLSANPWFYGNPNDLMKAVEDKAFDSAQGISDYLKVASKNGVGVGMAAGIGYAGRGLGLAIVNSTDFFLFGTPFPGGVKGYAMSDVSIVGGLALTPIKVGGLRLDVGADLRPGIRVYSPINAEGLLEVVNAMKAKDGATDQQRTALNSMDMYQGAGLGIDLGAKLALGDFTAALTFRDLFGTRYAMTKYGLGDWVELAKDSGGLPAAGTETGDTYVVPMNIILGAAYHLDLGGFSFFLDPTFHAELADPIGVFRDNKSPWSLLHLGTEVKVLRFIKLRAGLNQGYLTAGAGVRLLFLDVNVAAFTRELGRYAGDNPSTGVSAEVAIRF